MTKIPARIVYVSARDVVRNAFYAHKAALNQKTICTPADALMTIPATKPTFVLHVNGCARFRAADVILMVLLLVLFLVFVVQVKKSKRRRVNALFDHYASA